MPKSNLLKLFTPQFIKINKVPYKEKVCFLYEQAYQFYCDYHKMRISDSVDIHWHFYARRDALRAILDVMKNKRISVCFRKRVKQLIRWQRFEEVEYLGVL